MKKIGFIMVFITIMKLGLIHAQEVDKKLSFQIDPIMLLSNVIMGAADQEEYIYYFRFEFQYTINNNWNFIIRPNIFLSNFTFRSENIMFFNGMDKELDEEEVDGNITISIMPGIIYRPFGKGLRGMYVGLYPNIGWENIKYKRNFINDNFLILGIGIEAGYEWVFGNGFTITLGGGLGRNWGIGLGKITGDYKSPNSLYNLRFNFMLGYSF